MKSKLFYQLHFLIFLFCCFSLFSVEINDKTSSCLKKIYDDKCLQLSEKNEYIPLLRQFASECSSAVEIGLKSNSSTWSILLGLFENPSPKKSYIGIDLEKPPLEKLMLTKEIADTNGINFIFWQIDEMKIHLEPVDMLVIDLLHSDRNLLIELETFSPRVRKYICLHDTGELFSNQDIKKYPCNYSGDELACSRNEGAWPAVVDFLKSDHKWRLIEHPYNSSGFTVLKRVNENFVKEDIYHPDLENFLKNKIILCTGPALNRYDLLKQTTEADMKLIPFKKIFVTTNDPEIMNITFDDKIPVCEYIRKNRKGLDCLNCIITTMKNAVNDPQVHDDDIILFKHESVYINDMGLVKKALSKLLEGYNMVDRKKNNFATDVFFVKVSAIKDIVKDYPFVENYPIGIRICEKYFSNYIVSKIPKVYSIPYSHSNGGFTELGFYHIFSNTSIKQLPWNKKNYNKLFKRLSPVR